LSARADHGTAPSLEIVMGDFQPAKAGAGNALSPIASATAATSIRLVMPRSISSSSEPPPGIRYAADVASAAFDDGLAACAAGCHVCHTP
jgi:hypothetical protein